MKRVKENLILGKFHEFRFGICQVVFWNLIIDRPIRLYIYNIIPTWNYIMHIYFIKCLILQQLTLIKTPINILIYNIILSII